MVHGVSSALSLFRPALFPFQLLISGSHCVLRLRGMPNSGCLAAQFAVPSQCREKILNRKGHRGAAESAEDLPDPTYLTPLTRVPASVVLLDNGV
jgi:hypothetical protein